MTLRFPLGTDDFQKLREGGLAYVDKSLMIREIIDQAGLEVLLFPRPRRFGKTLNLSMIRCFFEKREEDLSHLFRDLAIWEAGEPYRAHFQRYPVIYLNFKGTKGDSFEATWAAIRQKIRSLFTEHRYLLDKAGSFDALGRERYQQILDDTAERVLYERAILDLSEALRRHHGEKVVVLLDEYDSPIQDAIIQGHAAEILGFMRNFFTEGLKTNPHLHRGVITGVLRIAKESLFSDANNLAVFTLLSRPFNTAFGFTEPEVASLLERAGRGAHLDTVRAWYNGYVFGGQVVYNPWSVLSYLVRGDATPRAYWLGTSGNELIRKLCERYALEVEPAFDALLAGGSVTRALDEGVVLGSVFESEEALFNLLVFSGYLKAEELPQTDPDYPADYRLSIPNREVGLIYKSTFRAWITQRLKGPGSSLQKLTSALLSGDAEALEEQLQAFVTGLLSYHDPGGTDPERVYHGFVLGLLAAMEPEYLVRSNRESGAGRPDVMIRAKEAGKPAVVMELKAARKGRKTPAAALKEGLAQIRERGYAAELLAAGASVVHGFAVAFDGKRVWVKGALEATGRGKKGRRAKRG